MKLPLQLLFLFFINFTFSQDYREAVILLMTVVLWRVLEKLETTLFILRSSKNISRVNGVMTSLKDYFFQDMAILKNYEYVKFEKNTNPKIMEVVEEGKLTLYK